MAGRRPSGEERALWRAAMRDVQPRTGAQRLPAKEVAPPLPAPAVAVPPAAAVGRGLDRRSALRLRRGQMPIEARLDLHGMIQEEAHRALLAFLARAQEEGRRAVLVITGKGSREEAGVLRRAVPRWLEEPACRGRILAQAPAQPKDGGAGALYVLLRRKR